MARHSDLLSELRSVRRLVKQREPKSATQLEMLMAWQTERQTEQPSAAHWVLLMGPPLETKLGWPMGRPTAPPTATRLVLQTGTLMALH